MSRAFWRINIAIVALMAALVVLSQTPVTKAATMTVGRWDPVANMGVSRTFHTANLLANGKVLVAGGVDSNNVPLSSAELYDPATRSWKPTGSMHAGRTEAKATLLTDGRVLVFGGVNGTSSQLTSTEIYDPTTEQWSITGSMSTGRDQAAAVLLEGGQVLAVGGWTNGQTLALNSAELYDPMTGRWVPTGSLAEARQDNWVVGLSNGSVLVAGGFICCGYQSLASAEVYDPTDGRWSTVGSMTEPRRGAPYVKLANGKVLIAGGETEPQCCPAVTSTAEVFDPLAATWTRTSPMHAARGFPTMSLLANADVLVAGGSDITNTLSSAEVYNPTTAQWTLTPQMPVATFLGTATLLSNGTVLVAGGTNSTSRAIASAEIYTPDSTLSCVLTAHRPGPPAQIVVTLQGAASGLKSVQVTQATNATFATASFTPGTTSPVVVTFTKINQSTPATVALRATDMAGNIITCDPVETLVAPENGMVRQTFQHLPQAEHFVLLNNGTPGLRRLVAVVNGERFPARDVRQGEQLTLDVGAAMRPGTDNTLRLVGYGKHDSSAEVLISDQP